MFIFVLFTLQVKFKLEKAKHRCCVWDTKPGPHDGRHRWIRWAMAAEVCYFWITIIPMLFNIGQHRTHFCLFLSFQAIYFAAKNDFRGIWTLQFDWFRFSILVHIVNKNIFSCLIKSNPVYLETVHTMILTPTAKCTLVKPSGFQQRRGDEVKIKPMPYTGCLEYDYLLSMIVQHYKLSHCELQVLKNAFCSNLNNF